MILERGVLRTWGAPIFRKDIVANPGLSLPLGLAVLAWVYLIGASQIHGGLPLCIGGDGGLGTKLQSALSAQWAMLDPRLGVTWIAMVVAMMLPITATHFSVAVAKTLPRYRWHVLAPALAGYIGVWLLLGVPYFGLFLLGAAVESLTVWPVVPGVIYGLAIAWSFASLRLIALRRCHPVPAFFGNAQDHAKASGIWGAKLAGYCAGVCFLAMSAPMLSGQGLMGMMIVTHVLLTERRTSRPHPRLVALPLVFIFGVALLQRIAVQ